METMSAESNLIEGKRWLGYKR